MTHNSPFHVFAADLASYNREQAKKLHLYGKDRYHKLVGAAFVQQNKTDAFDGRQLNDSTMNLPWYRKYIAGLNKNK